MKEKYDLLEKEFALLVEQLKDENADRFALLNKMINIQIELSQLRQDSYLTIMEDSNDESRGI